MDNEQKLTVVSFDPFFQRPEIRGKTDAAIAKLIGLDTATVRKMREHKNVPFDTIRLICRALECQPGDIMGADTVYVIPAEED